MRFGFRFCSVAAVRACRHDGPRLLAAALASQKGHTAEASLSISMQHSSHVSSSKKSWLRFPNPRRQAFSRNLNWLLAPPNVCLSLPAFLSRFAQLAAAKHFLAIATSPLL
jgi:hypothetical protein